MLDHFEIGPFRCDILKTESGIIHLNMFLYPNIIFTGNSYAADTPIEQIRWDAGVYAREVFCKWGQDAQNYLTTVRNKV